MYSEHALSSGYYCDATTISGTDPKIRKEMDDYFNNVTEFNNIDENKSLFKKIVDYVFTK